MALDGREAEGIVVASRVAAEYGIPIKVEVLANPRLAELYAASLVLIRPDQHVAWRGEVWPGQVLLDFVTGWPDEKHL